MSIILKNTTGSAIFLSSIGLSIPASSSVTIAVTDYLLLASVDGITEITSYINSGDIVVNDGTNDLTSSVGLNYLKYPNKAKNIRFDNSANDFDNHVLQEAVEELDFRQLIKEPTGFPNQTDSTISFDDGTRTFTISPVGDSFSYWIRGHEYIIDSSDDVQITDTEGLWFIYYYGDTLTASQTPWQFDGLYAFIALIYWDVTNQKSIIFGEERHGLTMDWATHNRLHNVDGAQIGKNDFKFSDFVLDGDGSLDSHAQFSCTTGSLYDEDLTNTVINNGTPSNPFEQELSPILNVPVYYREGTDNWRKTNKSSFACIYDGINTIKYNYDNAGNWSLQNASDGYFVTMWIYATNNIFEPIIAVCGQNQYSSLEQADINNRIINLDDSNLPFIEFCLLGKIIFETKTTYTNSAKASIRSYSRGDEVAYTSDSFTAWYTGSAGSGKYLDLYSGISSQEAPYVFINPSHIKVMTLYSEQLSTGTIGIYDINDLTTSIIDISLSNESYKKINYSQYFAEDQAIVIKVKSGSILKPSMRIWVQTIAS
jgi:hypothetical protein